MMLTRLDGLLSLTRRLPGVLHLNMLKLQGACQVLDEERGQVLLAVRDLQLAPSIFL